MELTININGQKIYEKFFCGILSIYEKYKERFESITVGKVNFKRKYIRDIFDEDNIVTNDFDSYIEEFIEIVEDMGYDLDELLEEQLEFSTDFRVTSRIKTRDSLAQKILKKMNSSEKGCYPINKIINDLFGMRIIDSNFLENKCYIEENIKKLEKVGLKVRYLEREVSTGYRANHIYISCGNNVLPIEIQFWNKADEENNILLHTQHKEEYLKNIIGDYNKY